MGTCGSFPWSKTDLEAYEAKTKANLSGGTPLYIFIVHDA